MGGKVLDLLREMLCNPDSLRQQREFNGDSMRTLYELVQAYRPNFYLP